MIRFPMSAGDVGLLEDSEIIEVVQLANNSTKKGSELGFNSSPITLGSMQLQGLIAIDSSVSHALNPARRQPVSKPVRFYFQHGCLN